METGHLSIHSENIFPIIKKWLYSDHDIFVRELISNASDAITKLKKLVLMGEAHVEDDEIYRIDVTLDPEAKTLTFSDNGIGMTAEEIKQYINQIAFSGAEDFVAKYKGSTDGDQIIGHFGLGFYSAFMVASRVEIQSLSHRAGEASVHWVNEGGTEFRMSPGSRVNRGTDVILHLAEDGADFASAWKLRETIEKYCSFMPYPIYLHDLSAKASGAADMEAKQSDAESRDEGSRNDESAELADAEVVETPLNTTHPLYLSNASEVTVEQYKEFYRSTFRDYRDPLFQIHLNMDYPFNLKGILYFPKLGNDLELMDGQIKLYNSQVFVADNIKEVIPEFLMLLKGVIDCPDLPLNVSRSFLQNDGFVRKISGYISKKVSDKLLSLFRQERSTYEGFWEDIHPFIKFGAIRDDKFREAIQEAILFRTDRGEYRTLNELKIRQGEQDSTENPSASTGKTTIYYANDPKKQAQY
ncbi:MAG: molecular chaperone HtpG, partial [Bacillota bacterium]|nr:molecular chaperone HtpG [Bacillota bacterium]